MPVYVELPADLLTPVAVYLKLAHQNSAVDAESFLFESVAGGARLARFINIIHKLQNRYSFIGTHPYKTITIDDSAEIKGDPLTQIESLLKNIRYATIPNIPSFTGGAVCYISYDSVQHFEPSLKQTLPNTLGIPDSMLMLYESIIVFDHVHQKVQVVSHMKIDLGEDLAIEYSRCRSRIMAMCRVIQSDTTPHPYQPAIILNQPSTSLIGKEGLIC